MTTYVRITKSDELMRWYKDRIGQVLPVVEETSHYYVFMHTSIGRPGLFIEKEHCEVVEGQHLISTEQLKEMHDEVNGHLIMNPIAHKLEQWFPLVFAPEKTTYKVGDRFTYSTSKFTSYELVQVAGTSLVALAVDRVSFFCNHYNKDGETEPKLIPVEDPKAITEEELKLIIGFNRDYFTLLPETTDQMV